MKYTLTLHEDTWLRDGPVYASGDITGYRIGGMPASETAKIANFGALHRNDWRIMRIKGETQMEWTGHCQSAAAAFAEPQKDYE